jgi:SAM-dependent methyltransferase
MSASPPGDPSFEAWLASLDRRYLADLTPAEVARALRALSSCYVERRTKLETGGALGSAGKRAAFALFYGPVHFVVCREIVRALDAGEALTEIVDVGCGTGVAGAAWALEAPRARVRGLDRHPWAVSEANWTYRELGVDGHAVRGDAARLRIRSARQAGIVAAYTLNELDSTAREHLLAELLAAHARGACVLVVEPIARRIAPWWREWADAVAGVRGRADEWRFRAGWLPERQRGLAKAAGLDLRELTARSLYIPPS